MKTLTETKTQESISRKLSLTSIVAMLVRHHLLRVTVTGVTLFFVAISASLSAAGSAQTYHGTLTGGDFFCNGELLVPAPQSVGGRWNLIIDPQTPAQLTLNVFYDNKHHLAYGYNALELVSFIDGVYVFSAFGGIATATLDTNQTPARFSFHVELGISCPDQYPYSSLTYYGVAAR